MAIVDLGYYYEEPEEFRLCRFCMCDLYRFAGNDYFEDSVNPGESHICDKA